jgi:hypothetical protein
MKKLAVARSRKELSEYVETARCRDGLRELAGDC